ncbi:MAG: spinster family MFS transporter [Woeseiaceae bacterium]
MTERGKIDAPVSAPYPSRLYSWYVVVVLTIIYVFSYIDRQILSLMVSDLKTGLNLEHDWQVGFLMGPAFAIFYTLFGIPFGRLADRVSRKGLIAFGLTVWSLMTAACGFAKNFTTMALLRVGVGSGEASLSPSAYSIIADYFPPNRMARAIAFYGMGIYLGGGMAYLIGGRVVAMVRDSAPWVIPSVGVVAPWQKVFLIVGLPGLVLLPLLWLTIREPRRRGLLKTGQPAEKGLPFSQVFAYLRTEWRTIATHNVGFALLAFSSYGTSAWLPEVFKRVHGWGSADFGLVYGLIVILCGSAGVLSGGFIADWLSQRGYRDAKIRVGFIAAWIWFPTGILFPLVTNDVIAMVLVAPTVFFAAMPFGVAPAAIAELMPNNLRGQTSAIYLFVINLIGLAIGPLVLALMTDFVFDARDYGQAGIRYSLLTTTGLAHVGATLLLWRCMFWFRRSLAARESRSGFA